MAKKRKKSIKELIKLAKQIQDTKDVGEDYSDLLTELQSHVLCPEIGEWFSTDHSAEYIVEYAMNWKKDPPKLSKSALVTLVTKIMNAEGTEAQIALMVQQFDANCLHPAKNGLIFYPDAYFEGNPDPSPEEIVARALSG